MKILDKNNLSDYLNYMVIDSDNNHAYITRPWSGDLVKDGIKRGVQTYTYENITYGKPYIKPITDEFNKNDELKIIGKLRGSD